MEDNATNQGKNVINTNIRSQTETWLQEIPISNMWKYNTPTNTDLQIEIYKSNKT